MNKEVRDLWNAFLSRGYGRNLSSWLTYLSLERELAHAVTKDYREYRKQISRAIHHIKDDPHTMADIWLNFERDYGDCRSVDACLKKIHMELAEVVPQAE